MNVDNINVRRILLKIEEAIQEITKEPIGKQSFDESLNQIYKEFETYYRKLYPHVNDISFTYDERENKIYVDVCHNVDELIFKVKG